MEVPCSRTSHVFRYANNHRSFPSFDYVAHNFKRIAEVWLGDFKHCLYSTDPERYDEVDTGSLTKAIEIKKSLNCKPFQYFLEQVMPDQVENYPCNPGVFASGVIRSETHPDLCLDYSKHRSNVDLSNCDLNYTKPGKYQHFELTWHRQIKKIVKVPCHCLDAIESRFHSCRFEFDEQLWFYNIVSLLIFSIDTILRIKQTSCLWSF